MSIDIRKIVFFFLFLYLALYPKVFTQSEGSPNQAEELILTITKIEGAVTVFDSQKNEWRDASIPHKLNTNDIVKTGPDSSCELEYNSSSIKIKQNAEVAVKSIIDKINLSVSYGEILIKLKKIPKDSSFTVETPQAIAGSRGTKYKVIVSRDRPETSISVLEASVFLQSIAEPEKLVYVKELELRKIAPWEKAVLSAKGSGILSRKILGAITKNNDTEDKIKEITEPEYDKIYDAIAKITTKRAAAADAYRNLAEIIYGVTIDSKTTLRDYAASNDVIKLTVTGVVKGARESGVKYYSDGSIEVFVEMEAVKVKDNLIPVTGDIYGIDCISGPQIIDTKEFEEFLL